MSKELVPNIRFKGFDGEWKESLLNEKLIPSREKNTQEVFSKDDVLSVSGDYGVVNQLKFKGRSFAGVSVAPYGVVHTNDVVYTKSPLKKQPYGIIKTNKGVDGIVSTLYAIYSCAKEVYPNFVEDYFNSDERLNSYLRPLVRKGAKNDMKISLEGALAGKVWFPEYELYCRRIPYSGKHYDEFEGLKPGDEITVYKFNNNYIFAYCPEPYKLKHF